MIRCFALAVSLLLVGAGSATAQTHPSTHSQGLPHDASGHAPMDPGQHAALHASLQGDWQGTVSMPGRPSSKMDLTVATDEAGLVTFRLTGNGSPRLGAASQLASKDRKVQWTQDVSGTPCKAVADVIAATSRDPETLKGTMSCTHAQMTFALHKTTK